MAVNQIGNKKWLKSGEKKLTFVGSASTYNEKRNHYTFTFNIQPTQILHWLKIESIVLFLSLLCF